MELQLYYVVLRHLFPILSISWPTPPKQFCDDKIILNDLCVIALPFPNPITPPSLLSLCVAQTFTWKCDDGNNPCSALLTPPWNNPILPLSLYGWGPYTPIMPPFIHQPQSPQKRMTLIKPFEALTLKSNAIEDKLGMGASFFLLSFGHWVFSVVVGF